jgi:hypothetical protein
LGGGSNDQTRIEIAFRATEGPIVNATDDRSHGSDSHLVDWLCDRGQSRIIEFRHPNVVIAAPKRATSNSVARAGTVGGGTLRIWGEGSHEGSRKPRVSLRF